MSHDEGIRAVCTGLLAIVFSIIFGTVVGGIIPRIQFAPVWRRRLGRIAVALVKYPAAIVGLIVAGLSLGVGIVCIIIAAAIAHGFERLNTRLEVPQS